jgi:hypothetical protein
MFCDCILTRRSKVGCGDLLNLPFGLKVHEMIGPLCLNATSNHCASLFRFLGEEFHDFMAKFQKIDLRQLNLKLSPKWPLFAQFELKLIVVDNFDWNSAVETFLVMWANRFSFFVFSQLLEWEDILNFLSDTNSSNRSQLSLMYRLIVPPSNLFLI